MDNNKLVDINTKIYSIINDDKKGFWYNLGASVGGPMYTGLYNFVLQHSYGKKVFFLSRDGYNLYNIFKNSGHENVEYLYTSRRSLLLACITEMNSEDIATLPPYTTGQTVGEIIDYLCVDREKIKHLHQAGFDSFDSIVKKEEDVLNFKKIYLLNKDVFLDRCALERKNALDYYNSVGLFEKDAVCFDCGWQGSSQILLEKFKKTVNVDTKHFFVYFGIKTGEKSQHQLKGMHYATYRFDFYKNHTLQYDAINNVVMYELFFSAPHESVFYYGENGQVVFEIGDGDRTKNDVLSGIMDFVKEAKEIVEQYADDYTAEMALENLHRLINNPTEQEATIIGNVGNVDGFGRRQQQEKYIAYCEPEKIDSLQPGEIYWLEGLLKRTDVDEYVKKSAAAKFSRKYPADEQLYVLEPEQDIRTYHRWLDNNCNGYDVIKLEYRPMFSVVVNVHDAALQYLDECLNSIHAQTYDNFELIILMSDTYSENISPVIQKYKQDITVQVLCADATDGILAKANNAVNIAKGDFIMFVDSADTIEVDALYQFAKKLNEIPQLDFIYSDEDKLTEDGFVRHKPFFKPDWSPDLFMDMMYTKYLSAYRTSVARQIDSVNISYFDGWYYDFTLRFMQHSANSRVGHISKILYHRRDNKDAVSSELCIKNNTIQQIAKIKQEYIHSSKLSAHLEYIPGLSQYRMVYDISGNPLVSIIVPSKDNPAMLKQCIDSVIEFTDYKNYEIIVVDNGSTPENKTIIETYLSGVNATYIYNKSDFNFSEICNLGVTVAKGDFLLFLNDGIEIFQPDWLSRMLGQAQQPHTGAVGAKLFCPGTVNLQGNGIYIGHNGPEYSFKQSNDTVAHYFGFNWLATNSIAVTGDCLLVSTEKFREAGCFDKRYADMYSDVKLCFDLYSRGYYNVTRNDVVAYHHRFCNDDFVNKSEMNIVRTEQNKYRLFADYPQFKTNDPFINCHMAGYQETLNLKNITDRIEEIDLTDCISAEDGSVDSVDIGRQVTIVGWSKIDGQDFNHPPQRYVVLKDPYGKTYAAKAQFYSRPDVAQYFGIEQPMYLGFESIISREELHVDMFSYDVGILTVDDSGQRHLKWCGSVMSSRSPQPAFSLPWPQQLSVYSPNVADATFSIDLCEKQVEYWQIRGFAYKNSPDHYNYRKSVVLLSEDGIAYKFEIQPEDRPDVAAAAPYMNFVRGSGFVCRVFNSFVSPGRYRLIIRMENQFNPSDVMDIVTANIITME